MNYVVIAVIAAPGYVLAAVLVFVLRSQGRDRAVVEAKLYTERDDAFLQREKLAKGSEQYSEEVAELNEEIKALVARNTGLSNALQDAQQQIRALNRQALEMPKRPARKKAGGE